MIRPLRRLHRRLMPLLALAVPAVLAVALGLRPEPAVSARLPTAPADLSSLPVLAEWPDLLPGRPLVVTVLGSAAGRTLEVRSTGPLGIAEPLVYASVSAAAGGQLPGDARLLGSLDDYGVVRGPLRDAAGRDARTLLIYSLAHSEVVWSAPLPELRG